MEGLGLIVFSDTYRDRSVFVTGHTGFKGSWLALWLRELGARVTAIGLPAPSSPNHWDLLDLDIDAREVDVRDAVRVDEVIRQARPAIVFHLAAQSLVRRSYDDPRETWSTNVLGTVNVLEACRKADGVAAIVVVTSDKCYANPEDGTPRHESDRLGGHDPYSASKAATELAAASYRDAYLRAEGKTLLATARAGNVIGGGDWSEDRLVPDLVRAVMADAPLAVRSPGATRPWQHVLDCLSGYLVLGERLLRGEAELASAWNFGPLAQNNRSVEELLTELRRYWPGLRWRVAEGTNPHEARLLQLDSSRARARLGWKPVMELEQAVAATAQWYRDYLSKGVVHSRSQLRSYVAAAREAGIPWTG